MFKEFGPITLASSLCDLGRGFATLGPASSCGPRGVGAVHGASICRAARGNQVSFTGDVLRVDAPSGPSREGSSQQTHFIGEETEAQVYYVTLQKQQIWELRPSLADFKAPFFPLLYVASVSLSIKWDKWTRCAAYCFARHCLPQNHRKLVYLFSPIPRKVSKMKERYHAAPRRLTRWVRAVQGGHQGQEPMGALPKPFLGFSNCGGLRGVIKRAWGNQIKK